MQNIVEKNAVPVQVGDKWVYLPQRHVSYVLVKTRDGKEEWKAIANYDHMMAPNPHPFMPISNEYLKN